MTDFDHPIDPRPEWQADHVRDYVATDGRNGHEWRPGVPTLLLTTKGRKTGKETTTPLIYERQDNDYVIGTGVTHTVQEFVEIAFGHVGLDWRQYVRVDPRFLRPVEVDQLTADASKARKVLGWAPETTFEQLIRLMVEEDLRIEGLDPAKYMGSSGRPGKKEAA